MYQTTCLFYIHPNPLTPTSVRLVNYKGFSGFVDIYITQINLDILRLTFPEKPFLHAHLTYDDRCFSYKCQILWMGFMDVLEELSNNVIITPSNKLKDHEYSKYLDDISSKIQQVFGFNSFGLDVIDHIDKHLIIHN